MCEREKHKSSEMERTREMISHDHQNIVSQISFPDKRKFGPKQTDGHARWDFPVSQAWKEIHVCILVQKKNKTTLSLSHKCHLFLEITMQTLRWLSHRGPKPMIQQSVRRCYSCLKYTETVLLFSDTG